MQSRVRQFRVPVTIPQGQQFAVEPCKQHMALWVVAGAQAFDAKQVVGLQALPQSATSGNVVGLNELLVASRVPDELAQVVRQKVLGLGAVDVRELTPADWAGLPSWGQLRPLEQRRLLKNLNTS